MRWSCSSCRASWVRQRTGDEVSVGVGRFGPFVKQGSTTPRSSRGRSVHDRTAARAADRAGKAGDAGEPLILDFGNGVQVLNGRYGAYITDGEKNARIPKEQEPKELTEAQCLELLAAAPVRKGRFGKKTARKRRRPKKAAAKKVRREERRP
jgi:DNA topoisomerase-1